MAGPILPHDSHSPQLFPDNKDPAQASLIQWQLIFTKKKPSHAPKNPNRNTQHPQQKTIHDAQTRPPFATRRRIPCLPDIARPPRRRRRRENGKL
jgi:hypothetical protein